MEISMILALGNLAIGLAEKGIDIMQVVDDMERKRKLGQPYTTADAQAAINRAKSARQRALEA